MSEYRRFVAYIYEYTNGKKNKNTGFAKVESRNGICRMQIHLQKIPQEENALNIYGFVREGGWLLGILLGQLSVKGACGEARIQTPAQNIGGGRYALSQLSGVWIEGRNGRKYLTVFDDESVDTEKLVTELPEQKKDLEERKMEEPIKEKQEEKSAEKVDEIHTEKEESGLKEEVYTDEKNEKSEKTAEGSAMETDESRKEHEKSVDPAEDSVMEADEICAERGNEKAEKPEENSAMKVEEICAEKGNEKPEKTTEAGIMEAAKTSAEETETGTVSEGKTAGKENENTVEAESGGEASEEMERTPQMLHAQEATACPASACPHRNQTPMGLEQKWQALSRRCPHFRPFADGEMADCIQITPRELSFIRQENCRMGNNSFLMHGFCNYRHLLFAKRRDGGYILGIPGIFENQELFMANMFGFPEFKEAASRRQHGRFGYWCRRM